MTRCEMTGYHRERMSDPAVRDGYPRTGRYGDRAGDPGDHRALHTRLGTREPLLHPATEHVWVAALEAYDELAGTGTLDEDPVDLVLLRGPTARKLRRVDDLDSRRQLRQQLARGEAVGHDHVGVGQRLAPREGDQLGIAWPAADQDDTGRPTAMVRRGDVARPKGVDQCIPYAR